jgi:L-histidine N-alpha-methyltransferase
MAGLPEQLERSEGTEPEAFGSARASMLADIRWGLAREQKELPSKYFYDTKGSELFEKITGLPEYYLTRTERRLLESDVATWIRTVRPGSVVELGAGSGRKTRILLESMLEGGGSTYAPVDVAGDFLEEAARALREDHPGLVVMPQVGDITDRLGFASKLPGPRVFALIGSTIGNFDAEAAVDLVSNIREAMDDEDHFLLGADLRPGHGKTVAELEAAYDDALGVTAEFNLNILSVINEGLGTDFDPALYRHRAFYDERRGRIEIHLVALVAHTVRIPGSAPVAVEEGESIRTELSCKYDRPVLEGLLGRAGLRIERWWTDERARYALLSARPI